MTQDVMLFMSGQLIAILIAIGISYSRTRETLVELKTRLTSLELHSEQGISGLRRDHVALSSRVDGISRAVARLEGAANLQGHNDP
jgi:hypothetical protein